ncbi:PP2C family protein-serine/threonine phosphatase [Pseudonocardia spinosispora]|uniref:PP2C family protein-serine/threonine phosphatase n=1 Tax=Pseudonocardia spinosispora TaxID=103441 RepID=UPI000404937F|nr:fused response regulator/phosphatase [Pseudonocardia spinosispora]
MAGPRVLLVEDDPGDVFLVRELLAEVSSPIELTVAATVAEAIEVGLATVDCVLLDLQLPDHNKNPDRLDGLRTLRAKAPENCAICVLTGLDDEATGAAAMAEGAQDYLIKGAVDGQLLTRSVRYSVERRRAERNAVRLRAAQLEQAASARVERGLLPRLLLDGSFVAAHRFYRPGRRSSVLGGDFYDALRCPDGSVHAIVGDVSGHGPDEAALGALLRVSWRALVLSGVGEPEVLPALQMVFNSEKHTSALFTTVCTVALFGEDTGEEEGAVLGRTQARLRVAGHPPPVLRAPGPVELDYRLGPPLGVLPDAEWPAVTSELPDGWELMMYSDGLIEGHSGGFGDTDPGDRLWTDGLLSLLERHRDSDLASLAGRLVEHAEELNGGPLVDDVAILLLTGAT